MLADYSYRWQLIGADWRKVISREQSLACIPGATRPCRRGCCVGWAAAGDAQARVDFEAREASAENYDRWLLGYLEEAAQGYVPKPYPGKITLLCSAREPKGLFLDRRMGWGAFALGGVDVAVIEGDHFTIFRAAAWSRWPRTSREAMALRGGRGKPPQRAHENVLGHFSR